MCFPFKIINTNLLRIVAATIRPLSYTSSALRGAHISPAHPAVLALYHPQQPDAIRPTLPKEVRSTWKCGWKPFIHSWVVQKDARFLWHWGVVASPHSNWPTLTSAPVLLPPWPQWALSSPILLQLSESVGWGIATHLSKPSKIFSLLKTTWPSRIAFAKDIFTEVLCY